MINKFLSFFISFILLVLLQVLLLNNIQLSGLINPYIYVWFILTLPVDIPKWITLFIALILGLTIDMFMNTMGMNAAATVFLAFCRPLLLKAMAPRDGYEFDTQPTVEKMGLGWFITYAAILVFLHHIFLFFVEAGRFSNFFFTFMKIMASSIVTLLVIIIGQYLFSYSVSRKT